jgi:hypothetical protein
LPSCDLLNVWSKVLISCALVMVDVGGLVDGRVVCVAASTEGTLVYYLVPFVFIKQSQRPSL